MLARQRRPSLQAGCGTCVPPASVRTGIKPIRSLVPAALALIVLLSACASPAPRTAPPQGHAAPPATRGALAALDSRFRAMHEGATGGFVLLPRNEDGLRWRIALVDAATSSLDLQYYIWWGDPSGDLLMKHVVDAADRGVRVRLILDDISTVLKSKAHPEGQDWDTAMLDTHPNIQVRLFNASHARSLLARGMEFVAHADKLNQRMHNKLMVADNRAMVVGGRNIGDEYFGLSDKLNFLDLDVLGVGEIATQASTVFDRFWNSPWVTTVASLHAGATQQDLREQAPRVRAELEATASVDDFSLDRDSSALKGLLKDLKPGTSQMLSDHLDEQTVEHEMAASVRTLMLGAQKELLIINAYVIPDDGLLEVFRTLHERGVSVRILTNSLATEDVAAVNSHYKSWRKRLLEAGVDLHELRADAAVKSTVVDTPPIHSQRIGLHMKCLSVDRQSIFVGSMNLDPRSKSLNTEMGVTIHSPVLAQELASFTEQMLLPANSWQLAVDAKGALTWVDDKETLARQPAQGSWQRVEDEFFMMLPSSLY